MATVLKRPAPQPAPEAGEKGAILRAFDAIYRFLASLKLAVFSIATLAAVLAYATFFESSYGTHAVQEWIYRSRGFALLLAFLGINVLCAATIRFRWDAEQKGWKRRQTGFVITHVGLLITLLGSYITLKTYDEGNVMLAEGESGKAYVRVDHASLVVQKLDPESGQPSGNRETALPFRPGAFDWDSRENAVRFRDTPKIAGVPLVFNRNALITLGALIVAATSLALMRAIKDRDARDYRMAKVAFQTSLALAVTFGAFYATYPTGEVRRDVVTGPDSPFQLIVKDYIAASSTPIGYVDEARPGPRKIKVSLDVKPPTQPNPVDAFGGDNMARWLEIEIPRLGRVERQAGAATVSFSFVDSLDKLDDFLNPPKDPLKDHQARFHYKDKDGKDRVYEWVFGEGKEPGETFALPDSDLTVTFAGEGGIPISRKSGDVIQIAEFRVRKGDGPQVMHMASGSMPMVPNIIPRGDGASPEALVRIAFFHPPEISGEAMGRNPGLIEVMAAPDGKLYYRSFNRGGLHGPDGSKKPGPIRVGQTIDAFGPEAAMKARFRVDDYFPSGVLEKTYESMVLPKGEADAAVPAALVEMRAEGKSKTFWVQRAEDPSKPSWQTVDLGSKGADLYRLSFDFDRRPLDFELTLRKAYQDNDPGTRNAANYTSEVTINDPELDVLNKDVTITMNEPLRHHGKAFYQSKFMALRDPRTGRFTGENESVFQVAVDPYWWIKYLGCVTVVVGTFVQFYMRAGVFHGSKPASKSPTSGDPTANIEAIADEGTAGIEEL